MSTVLRTEDDNAGDRHCTWTSATTINPLEVTDEADVRDRPSEAEGDVAAGRVKDARVVSTELGRGMALPDCGASRPPGF